MLTRRGWGVLAGALVLAATGRMLGIQELYVLAAAGVALVAGATWQVRSHPIRLAATRLLHPAKVHAGSDSRVELAVRNRGGRRSPVVAVRDPFDGGRRQARFLIAPLAAEETARAAYRLPTTQRGVFSLGPLEVRQTDAFGLATTTAEAAPATQLTVFPHVDPVAPLPHTLGHDPHAGADHPNALGLLGEDFYALRPYEIGDDLRRVHWPSTARLDELTIRQDEMPWQGRVTVVLDNRRSAHTPESFELAVSAAASIVTANWRRRSLVRLATTGGFDSGWAAGAAHAESVMEHLAAVRAVRHDRLAEVVAGLRRAGNGGALAFVTAGASAGDLAAVARLRGRFGLVTSVVFEPSSWDRALAARPLGRGSDPPGATGATGAPAVRVSAATPFPVAWNMAMARAGSGRAGRRSAPAPAPRNQR